MTATRRQARCHTASPVKPGSVRHVGSVTRGNRPPGAERRTEWGWRRTRFAPTKTGRFHTDLTGQELPSVHSLLSGAPIVSHFITTAYFGAENTRQIRVEATYSPTLWMSQRLMAKQHPALVFLPSSATTPFEHAH
ncbi:unnamed protein product [Pleuronectes platessa]|uniref:Uncharacterized protein n=1 Tax=Pleuronectes platessa TaxID=8262 RepID=A0A9N7VX24_PLEPL|nr:unnamed protein product [Pleuronectes platessa]